MRFGKSSAAKGKVHSNTSLPQETTEKKTAGVTILTSDKIDFEIK